MKGKSRSKNSAINMATGACSQAVSIVLKFIVRTVFIYYLGKEYLGINGLFSDILSMLSLSELGIDTAIQFKLYKPLATGDVETVQVWMKFYKIAYRIVGFVIIGIGLCLIPFLPNLIKDYDTLDSLGINAVLIFLLYLSNSACSYLFFASNSAILKADQKLYIINISTTIITVVSSALQIISLAMFQSFIIYIAITIVAAIVQNLINAVIAHRKYPTVFVRTNKKLDKSEIRNFFKDLGAVFVSKVNTVVLKATDNLVLSTFIGLSIVGLYSNYLLFYTTLKSIISIFYNASKASAGNFFAKESEERQYLFFKTMNFLCVLLYGIGAVSVAVVANELIHCWIGDSYIVAQPLSILIGIEILFAGIKQNLTQIRNVTGLFRQMWFRPLLGTIVNLVVSIILVQFIGIYGVIIGTIVADITTNFMIDPSIIYKNVFKTTGVISEYYIKNLRYIIELSLVCIFDIFICAHFITGLGWISIIVHGMICAISVTLVLVFIHHSSQECHYLFDFIKSFLNRRVKKLNKDT